MLVALFLLVFLLFVTSVVTMMGAMVIVSELNRIENAIKNYTNNSCDDGK